MIKTLSQCLSLVIDRRGVTPKKLGSDWREYGYRVLSANNVKTSGIDKLDEIRYIDEETYRKWMKEEVKRGDILLTSEAPAGEVYYWDSDEKIVAGQRVYIIRTTEEVNSLFLKYYIQSSKGQKEIINKCSGSTVFGISAKMFDSIEIVLPRNKIIQDKIAKTLKVIDDKIENNIKINEELESMVKIIYNYWFLQFEFPNKEGKPYKSSGGKMVWNDELKREIPESFSLIDITDVCEITDCLHSKKPDFKFEDEQSYLLSLENITKEGYIDLSNKYYISKEDYNQWIQRICVQENDFIVTNAGRAGDIGKIPKGVKCAIGRNITSIRPVHINAYYLRQFFKSNYIQHQIRTNLDCGSFFKSFNVKSIKKLRILLPESKIYNRYSCIITPIIKQIENNINENQQLISLRDFLLPLLMNGQVSFKEKSKEKEEVLV